jgi:hypothetical protein
MCTCGHPYWHHNGDCRTLTVSGPATLLDRHEGRTLRFCPCMKLQEVGS